MTGKCGEKSEEKSRPVKLNEPIMIMGKFRLNVMKRDFGDLVRECGDLPFKVYPMSRTTWTFYLELREAT